MSTSGLIYQFYTSIQLFTQKLIRTYSTDIIYLNILQLLKMKFVEVNERGAGSNKVRGWERFQIR